MASRETNEAKRAEMKALVAKALEGGWTRQTLAAVFGLSASSMGAWANGRSMGSNQERDMLALLPPVAEAATFLETWASKLEVLLAEHVAKYESGNPGYLEKVRKELEPRIKAMKGVK